MRYEVNANTFMQLPYTTGTIQNVSNTDIEISNEQTIGTGIVLKAGEIFAFNNATVYACARPVLNGGTGIISVVPFNGEGEGGESPIYVPKGSIAFASLPTTLNSTMLGWTYNVSDSFTTDSRFIEGAGVDYPAGENVVVVEPTTGTFKYDCFGGAYILPVANTTTLGGVKVGTGVEVANEKLNVKVATANEVAGVLSSADEGKVSVNNDGTMTYNPLGYRQPSTAYAVGNIAYHASLPTGWYLECTTAGTSGSGDLTISSPTIGGTVTDGTVTWTIREMESTEYRSRVIVDNAAAHNSIYRGKDLTAYFDSGDMSTAIANGSFKDIYPGDYIIKSITIDGTTYSNVKFIVMDLDYHLHCGDTETTAHHVAIMPEEQLGTAQMNTEHTTAGGYAGSAMFTTHIPKVDAGIEAAFGSAHVLSHRELLSNSMDANLASMAGAGWQGAANNWAWYDTKSNLANETMVYGGKALSSSFFDISECKQQLAAFRLNHGLTCSARTWWWLRSVARSSSFCDCDGGGIAGSRGAAGWYGVRPYFLLR